MAIKEPFLFSTCQSLAHCERPDIRELCTEFCCSSAAASMYVVPEKSLKH